MGPKMLRLTGNLWKGQKVVAKQSGFYGPAFNAEQGKTQGGTAAPTRFNIIVDKVVRHWLTMAINDDRTVAADGFGMQVSQKLAMFYADDGLTASRDHNWLQHAMDALVALFGQMGLQANVEKTQTMTCYPGLITSALSREAHERRVTGEGQSCRQRLRNRVTCPDCGKELSKGLLNQHRRQQHGVEPEIDWPALAPTAAPSTCYPISFPAHARRVQCPHLSLIHI